MTVTADALDLLAGDPPRYPHVPGDFIRHPETGAPYVNHPTETKKDGTPRRVMYGRPSSFGSALDNPYNLVKWKERQLLTGAWLIDADEQIFDGFDPAERDTIDRLAGKCHDAAGSHLAADRGTHVHLLCERVDRDEGYDDLIAEGEALGISEALQLQIIRQWAAFRARLGLTALAVEQTVVNDRWRLAGTLDRLDVADHDILTAYGIIDAHCPFVGDIKTGSLTVGTDGQPNYWVKYPVQLAAYVDAVPYDVDTDERARWLCPTCHGTGWQRNQGPHNMQVPSCPDCRSGERDPNPHIALIYHYDLARPLNGEPVDWQAIPVNVDAGREGGDLCRAAADFAKRRDLFAMPAPTPAAVEPEFYTDEIEAPVGQLTPNPIAVSTVAAHIPMTAEVWREMGGTVLPVDRDRLRARIAGLIDQGHEQTIRARWPADVPPLSRPGHTDDQLAQILAAVRRVETEVGAPWHPDDGPPPHVNTNPRAEIAYPVRYRVNDGYQVVIGRKVYLGGATFTATDEELDAGDGRAYVTPVPSPDPQQLNEGPLVNEGQRAELLAAFRELDAVAVNLCSQIANEANAAGRSMSVTALPSTRRWTIARAVIAWAASGRSVDDLWFTASMVATFEQCCDRAATLGGLISQFTIEQANRLYESASNQ